MIVALLVLIVLILLFGSAAVKGWIKGAVAWILAFVIFCIAATWLGSFFGENGFAYVMFGTLGLLFVLGVIGKIMTAAPPTNLPRKGPRPKR